MFKTIREFFRKTCRDCEYYSYHREQDKLQPDKTVVLGKILCETCEKMDCRLKDMDACAVFKPRTRTHNSFHAFRIHTQGHSRMEPPR